ncbi:helical backbone metal receptor [Chloroflexus sp.]|uniref:helical backbone metal receptor n=1 Tax=Chloroflexus sp. TaxID=1904827 RepID=UPI00260D286F|nr:helical backbone metal receptor [uncultured Chloroflexus sp.]
MTQVRDALGRIIELAAPPQRIVSLVPSMTEWLFSVGAGERVIGVTRFCIEPAAAIAHLPRLGGTKNPDRAAIIALRPDLVIAEQEENRERDVQALIEAGINVYVTAIRSVADVVTQLTALAAILDVSAAATPMMAELRAALIDPPAPNWRVLALIWRDPWMAIGQATYAGDLLRLSGGINVAERLPGRYPRATLAEFLALEPELILLPSEPYPFSERDLPVFAAVDQRCRIEFCDGMALTWPGPRSSAALTMFRQLLQQPL